VTFDIPFEIRPAIAADAPALSVLVRALAASQGDPDDKATPRRIARDMLDPSVDMMVLVAESPNSMLLGYVAGTPAYESSHAQAGFYVSDLFVMDRYRGQGIGRSLLSAFAALARSRGRSYLWWAAKPGNTDADRFYRRIADIRETVTAYAVTGERFDALCSEAEAAAASEKQTS
jgi:GNAT superfamily N-acetyltransferase